MTADPTNPAPPVEELLPCYLLVKRGLYYCPNNQGYTGIKERAGRYLASDADPESGVSAVHEDEAPMFSKACWEDVKVSYLLDHLSSLTVENERREAFVTQAARAALLHVEHARTDVVNPVNGSAPYSFVIFHGQRIEFHDNPCANSFERDAGSGKAAAYAQKINDGLFELAKAAARAALSSLPAMNGEET